MAYTTIDNPSEYFLTKLYAGNGSTQDIGGIGFQPDWVWLKNRTDAGNDPVSIDSVRGVTKEITTNTELAEVTNADGLTAFGSDGFSVGDDDMYNTNAENFVSWNWLAGTSFSNDASSTSVGSIDSAGSVNTDANFSIIGYTGTGGNGTVAHGLGVAPSMIIFKNRDTTNNWNVFHKTLGNAKFIRLNDTGAAGNTSRFNSTSPTSSVFSLGTTTAVNGSGNSIIAYCFAEVKGYSKMGSYEGNGANDGPFVYTGFKPAFLLLKNADAGGKWVMFDTKRDPINVVGGRLFASVDTNELTGSNFLDINSNGFKILTGDTDHNGDEKTNIYMAFAENPFVTSTGIPATAR